MISAYLQFGFFFKQILKYNWSKDNLRIHVYVDLEYRVRGGSLKHYYMFYYDVSPVSYLKTKKTDTSYLVFEVCNCDLDGSLNQECIRRTGQCKCRDKFGGRRCDQCQVQYT